MKKDIYENFDSEAYAEMLAQAKEEEVHIVHHYDRDLPKGGYTFVWTRDNPFSRKGKMVRVAVSFCSSKDHYCRKIGASQALANFYAGENILLPVGEQDSELVVEVLRNIFSYSQNAYSS